MERRYKFGISIVIIGGFFLSLSGILLRHIESADGWQILFYRGIAFSTTLLLLIILKYKKETFKAFKAIGYPGLWAGLVLGLGSICYVFALLLTTVANAVFIIGASPIATAAVGWFILGEKTSKLGLGVMFVSLVGIGLMFADGLMDGRLAGNIAALGVVASFVVFLLILRSKKDTDMLPATCLTGLVMAFVSVFFVTDFLISQHDLVIALLMGSLQFGVGFWCYTLATRYILASEVALFSLSESIFAPIWVWIGVGEQPSLLTMAGSLIVLVGVTAYCLVGIAEERKLILKE
jgi:drug/metabolite transporter (DMT)-like permease